MSQQVVNCMVGNCMCGGNVPVCYTQLPLGIQQYEI